MKLYTRWADVRKGLKTKTQWADAGRSIVTGAKPTAIYNGRHGPFALYSEVKTRPKHERKDTGTRDRSVGSDLHSDARSQVLLGCGADLLPEKKICFRVQKQRRQRGLLHDERPWHRCSRAR